MQAYGQRPDVLCMGTDTVRGLIIAAKEGKEYKKQVLLLNERLSLKDQVIFQMNSRDSLVRTGYENQMSLLRQELDLRKDQVNGYERLLRKERRKRFWTGVLGMATTGAMAYLLITK